MFSGPAVRWTNSSMQKFGEQPGQDLPSAPTEVPPSDEKTLGRVDRMQQAYTDGEIDAEMIAKAAKVLRITEEEARRRLSSRIVGAGAGSRADRRRTNKAAKASRRKNRH